MSDGGIRKASAASSMATYDDDDPEYECCCGTMHVRMGSAIIAAFSMLGLGINLAYRISVDNSTISAIVPLIVGTLAVVSLIIALRTGTQQLIIPFLLVQALGLAAVLVLFILCFVSLFVDSSLPEASDDQTNATSIASTTNQSTTDSVSTTLTMVVLLGEMILQLWFLHTVWRCYCYFVALKRRKLNNASAVGHV